MNPIAIFRHLPHEGAGYLAEFLAERDIPMQLIAIDAGDAIPTRASDYAGLVFMGGNMSVNDDLPWIPQSLALIRDAVAHDVPVLGHCLGAQLLSKALGGQVTLNPVKEIGWGEVQVADSDTARVWFGDITAFPAFHWHGETFSLPAGAELILSSAYCSHQAYAVGAHLGLQCHVEMTEAMIEVWCIEGREEILSSLRSPAVQSVDMMRSGKTIHLSNLRRVADLLYSNWLRGVEARA